jgi:hypothetical protein
MTEHMPQPVCVHCDNALTCGRCGAEQPYDDVSVLKSERDRLRDALLGIVTAWEECVAGSPPSDYDQSPAFLAERARRALQQAEV